MIQPSAPLTDPASACAPARPALGVRLRRVAVAVGLFGLLGALLYAKAVPCAFAGMFHTPCPGCGSTRAVVALLHGDVHGAIHHNPLGPVTALLLGVLGAQALASVFAHGDLRGAGAGRLGLVVKGAIVVVAALQTLVWIGRFFGLLGGPVPV